MVMIAKPFSIASSTSLSSHIVPNLNAGLIIGLSSCFEKRIRGNASVVVDKVTDRLDRVILNDRLHGFPLYFSSSVYKTVVGVSGCWC